MVQLTYCSSATRLLTALDCTQLVAAARVRNQALGVTGMLLYHSGSILQVLEGPEHSVDTIFAAVAADPRHTEVRTLVRQTRHQRDFDGWHMAFVNTSNTQMAPPAIVDYHRVFPSLTLNAADAKRYLRHFQRDLLHPAG